MLTLFSPRGCLAVSGRNGHAPVAAIGTRLLAAIASLGVAGGVSVRAAFAVAVYARVAVGRSLSFALACLAPLVTDRVVGVPRG